MGITHSQYVETKTQAEASSREIVPHAKPAHPPKKKTSAIGRSDLDQFKFRLNEHAGLCYFEGVSFKTPNLTEPDQRAVVEFFEGTCLNHLRPSALRAALPHLAILPALQELVNDLQQIFCD